MENPPLENVEQLRVISITNKLSIMSEKFILRWIWPHIKHNIDRDQFGGISRNSVAHYLIEITNFILYNLDMKTPMATILTMFDFSK